ncbi:MAG: site-specific DNA-methyltransferase [Verrucomicrobiales bacterium]|nr:site-specific DNA-methyltransferase [Verrucomicrobiales bacterium]
MDGGKERYGMNWSGKADCFRTIQQTSMATLVPAQEESVNFDATGNLIIEGDNLEVLKLLQKAYFGKVKMIYIDPPYNTGNDFIYPDNYSESLDTYLRYTGQVDDEGRKFSTNTEADGRFHSKWMNMMYPRLFLARNLLRDDGVIFISIDDAEVDNLRKICNEVFWEENFLACIVWQKKYAATNDSKGFSTTHDYIVVYQKSESFKRNLLPRTEEQNAPYKNDDGDGKGLWRSDNLLVKSFSSSGVYPIINPNTKEQFYPPEGSCWRASQDTMEKWLKENRIYFGKDGKGAPQLKRYLNEVQQGRVPITWWAFEEVGHNDAANKEVSALFESKTPFDTPKPSSLIKQMLFIATDKSDIVLDFFAGSGTAAHSVLQLNQDDGGTRKFILVQLPEPCAADSDAAKAGYKTIADITKERVRRVIKKLQTENQDQLGLETSADRDLGFKVFKLQSSNFTAWNRQQPPDEATLVQELKLHVDHLTPGRSQEDVLYELLLKSGFPLTVKIEKLRLADRDVYAIADGSLLICLEQNLTPEVIKAIADRQPSRMVCLDAGFANNDQLKTNAVQIMKSKGVVKFQTV